MIFTKTGLPGAYLLDIEKRTDDRGFFARSFCREEFLARGLDPDVAQCNVSFSRRRGTLRGMHWQAAPREEAKLVRCTRGALFDVIVDIRPGSAAFCRHFSVILQANEHRMLYVPKGFVHGFLTIEDDTEVFYQMSEPYAPDCARGARWDDPAFAIVWPEPPRHISDRDRSYPDFRG